MGLQLSVVHVLCIMSDMGRVHVLPQNSGYHIRRLSNSVIPLKSRASDSDQHLHCWTHVGVPDCIQDQLINFHGVLD